MNNLASKLIPFLTQGLSLNIKKKKKKDTQTISVPMKYLPALIIFVISFTPMQSFIKLISLKCEGEISNGTFESF